MKVGIDPPTFTIHADASLLVEHAGVAGSSELSFLIGDEISGTHRSEPLIAADAAKRTGR